MNLLYTDNHLLAADKPAGLQTQPSGTDRPSLEDEAKAWVKREYAKPGNVFLEAVHRLDKSVSGVVLFARTSKALSRLNAAQRARDMVKVYEALLEQAPPSPSGVLEHYLAHGSHRAIVTAKDAPNAKMARLSYRVLSAGKTVSRVEIRLETGRYHQIRAQFAAIGCPVLGDINYGSTVKLPGEAIALHHARLEFQHPVRDERVCIEAPPPSEWDKA